VTPPRQRISPERVRELLRKASRLLLATAPAAVERRPRPLRLHITPKGGA
jgi:hypothetical protein